MNLLPARDHLALIYTPLIYTPALVRQKCLQAGTTRAWKHSACLECFLGQIRKKTEAVGSNPAISGLFFLLPRASWSTALADPLLKHKMLLHIPKPQSSTKGPVSRGAAACHVCFPCQNPELHSTVGEKGKGEKSSVETHQSLNISLQQNKALGNLFSAWVP